jgi:hypothetical protein
LLEIDVLASSFLTKMFSSSFQIAVVFVNFLDHAILISDWYIYSADFEATTAGGGTARTIGEDHLEFSLANGYLNQFI